jgi:hypothetical protein
MDTNVYIACLRQVVALAPKVILIACLRQVVAFAPKVIKCAAYGVAQRRTEVWADGWADRRVGTRGEYRFSSLVK